MENDLKTRCLRCSHKMQRVGIRKIQLGETELFFGTWSNLLSGALEVEIYHCAHCGKLEFYSTDSIEPDEPDVDAEVEADPAEYDVEADADESFQTEKLNAETEEFFQPENLDGREINCPHCGKSIDADFPICPFCGYQR